MNEGSALVSSWCGGQRRRKGEQGRAAERQREADTDTSALTQRRGGAAAAGSRWAGLCVKQSTCCSSLRETCRTHADRGSAGNPVHLRGMKSATMSPTLFLCAVLAVYQGTRTCSGFNIDERFPVIKEGKTKGSFFGFSVALHEQQGVPNKYL